MERKYLTVMKHIKAEIHSGRLKPGSRLPSIRAMSDRFHCSKNTIILSYANLEKEKLIYSAPKSGYYVLHQNVMTDVIESDIIDFSSNNPDPSAIPHHDFYQCLNQAIEIYQDKIFSYVELQGFYSLRKLLEKHLMAYQVFVKEEQIFIISGAHQAFHFLNLMPFPNGKTTILVEQPSFSNQLKSLQLTGNTVIGITRTKDGINMNELETHFRNNHVKFFYTIPRNHPSVGTSYTMEQKKQIAELAEKYDVYIVEDDYIADLENDKKADPIFSLDRSGHTVYLKSFSKILSPGLRLAVIALPTLLIKTFELYKFGCDRGSASLSQGALEIFLSNGMYDRHVKRVREKYSSRLAQLKESCMKYLPKEMEVTIPESGIYSIITFPGNFPISKLVSELDREKVLLVSTADAFLRTYPKEKAIRISILRTNHLQIDQGIRKLGEVIKRLL